MMIMNRLKWNDTRSTREGIDHLLGHAVSMEKWLWCTGLHGRTLQKNTVHEYFFHNSASFFKNTCYKRSQNIADVRLAVQEEEHIQSIVHAQELQKAKLEDDKTLKLHCITYRNTTSALGRLGNQSRSIFKH